MEDGKVRQTRRRMDERSWRAVLSRYEAAAMTVQEFCLREGLTRSSFARWRARLRSETAPDPVPAAQAARAAARPSFVDLGLLEDAGSTGRAGLDLRLELGGGISLHLVRR